MQHRIARLSTLILLLMAFDINAEPDLDAMIGLEQTYLQDLPIVLSATRLAQPLSEAPVAITVIDRKMIEASGARTIPDLLRLVPGFQVGYFDGNTPVATYHGHGEETAKHLQVLIDGRSVYLPSRNAVPWSDLVVSIDDIERIEVIRGPNAATYGSNSFMAVVSITTRHAIETQGHYVRVRTGSQNTNDALYEFGAQEGKLDYRVTLSTINDEGTDALPDDTETDAFNYRLDYQIDTRNTLMYKGGYKEGVFGEHIPAPADDPLAGHYSETKSAYQHMKWEHQLKKNDSISLQYYYNYHHYLKSPLPTTYTTADFPSPLSIPGVTTLEDLAAFVDANPTAIPGLTSGDQVRFDAYDFAENVDITSERHDLEFNHYYYPTNDLRMVWGLSARQDIVTAPSFFDESGTQRLNMYRAFAHGEWNFSKDWLLNAGYMIEDNDISGNNRSPRLALIHHIDPNHTIRVGVSMATRTPTLFEEAGQLVYSEELTLNGLPLPSNHLLELTGYNPLTFTSMLTPGNLNSEEITSYEIGYIANLINDKLLLDVKIFKDQTRKLITFDDTQTVNDYTGSTTDLNANGYIDLLINGLESKVYGTEIALDYKVTNTLRLYSFYAHLNIDSRHFINSTEEKWTRRLNNTVPEDSGGLMIMKKWPGNIDTSLAYYNVGDMAWLDRTNDDSAQAYQKVDARIAKTWQSGKEVIKIAVIGQNLKEDVVDYNNRTTTDPMTGEIRAGSIQDKRFYLELSFLFI